MSNISPAISASLAATGTDGSPTKGRITGPMILSGVGSGVGVEGISVGVGVAVASGVGVGGTGNGPLMRV